MKQQIVIEESKSGLPHGPLTTARALQLVERILPHDDDDQAAALMELVLAVANDEDHCHREDMAHFAMQHAFTMCMAFDESAKDFYLRTCGVDNVEDKAEAQHAGQS